MQLLEQGGVKYIYRIDWNERASINTLFKPVKTYDYIYAQPTQGGTDILAIKAKSIITRYTDPTILPGVICVQLTPFNTISSKNIMDIKTVDKTYKNFPLQPDFILPSLDDCLSKYLFLCQDPQQYILDVDSNCIIYAMAYHMINRMLTSYGDVNYYKQLPGTQHITMPETIVTEFRTMLNSLKADDGAKLVQLGSKRLITIYAGLLPLNKSDLLEIHLYDNPLDNKFLITYVVLKKNYPAIEVNLFYIRV